MDKLKLFLDRPVKLGDAFVAVGIAHCGTLAVFAAGVTMEKHLRAQIKRDQRARAILDESCEFLISRADDATLVELNNRMNFWRAAQGMPIEKDIR